MLIGAATAALADLCSQYLRADGDPNWTIDWGELIATTAIGSVVGLIPDILEPATSPHHRGVFHSVASGAIVISICRRGYTEEASPEARMLAVAIAAGYLSHLGADSLTPQSIRLI
jgi:membrane-bound metal-dependent hydrolase YbcI (DUF457 family)